MPNTTPTHRSLSPSETEDEKDDMRDDHPLLLQDSQPLDTHATTAKRRRRWLYVLLHGVLFTLSLALFISAMMVRRQVSESLRSGGCGYKDDDAVYSPVKEAVKYETVVFDGKLNTVNKYKGPLGPELDRAWTQLLDVGPIAITAEELRMLNRTSVEFADRDVGGTGKEGTKYMAKLDVFHQLHCLDHIRRQLHPDYYASREPESVISPLDHADHCIDILRQSLMCTSDTTLVTFDWVPGYQLPWPNFSFAHKCHSFDAVAEWARKEQIVGRKRTRWRKPSGEVVENAE